MTLLKERSLRQTSALRLLLTTALNTRVRIKRTQVVNSQEALVILLLRASYIQTFISVVENRTVLHHGFLQATFTLRTLFRHE